MIVGTRRNAIIPVDRAGVGVTTAESGGTAGAASLPSVWLADHERSATSATTGTTAMRTRTISGPGPRPRERRSAPARRWPWALEVTARAPRDTSGTAPCVRGH